METATPSPPPARALFKDMLQGSGMYMIAMLATRLASFVLVPVVTGKLTTAEYGVVDLLEQTSVVLSLLLGVNFSSALGYFYFEADAVKSRVVGTTLTGSVLLGSLAGLVGWILSEPISRAVFHSLDYLVYLRAIFVLMPLSFLLEAGLGWLRVENRAALYTGAVLFRVCLIIAGTLTLVLAFHLKVAAVIGANLTAIVLTALLIFSLAVYFRGLSVNVSLFKRMLRFAAPMCLSSCGLFVMHFGDRFIVPRYRPLSDLGVYAIAYKFGMLIGPVQTAFDLYWNAQMFHILKRPDGKAVFKRIFTYWITVLSFCTLVLLVASPPVMHRMMPPSYWRAAYLVPLLLGAYFLRALGDFFRYVLLANGFPHYEATCIWITAAFSIGAYFLLIPPYGITGAAVATVLTFVLALVISIVWSYRIWPYQLDLSRVGKVLTVSGALAVIYFFLPSTSFLADSVRGGLLLLAFPALLYLWRFPTPAEKALLRSALARVAAMRA